MKKEKDIVAKYASTLLGIPENDVLSVLEYPPQPHLGDLAIPCFRFAKTLRKAPSEIAGQLGAGLQTNPLFDRIEVTGGYVNVTFERVSLANAVVDVARTETLSLFSTRRGTGQRVAIDFSSPNIAKPFGVGHLRSTMIGESLLRILQTDGYETVGINHLGDWGTQFGKNIVAYLRWGDEEVVRKDPVRELFHLYVKFHQEAPDHPELEEEARAWFKKLEDGDAEATRLWKWFISESLTAFQQTYELLGVSFDHYLGESFYNDKMEAVIKELRDRELLVESDGAEVVDLSEWNMPPCIIRKSDGATIYATRDLAAALYRNHELGASRLIYVVGSEQTLHFAQVFKVLELMDRPWAKDCQHVAFGMMKYNGERLSTRRGKVVYLEDVLQRAISEAQSIIDKKNPALPDKEEVAKAVGIGAVVFNDLKSFRMHDVDFKYEDVLNFDGETGPYVQYTHARASSVLRKAQAAGLDVPAATSFKTLSDTEWRLIHLMNQADEIFERTVDDLDPSLIARFALDVCHAFNRFYHDEPILTAEPANRDQRLALTEAIKSVLATSLYLLGLAAPQAM